MELENIYIYAASYSAWQSWSVWYTETIHPGKETSGCAIYHYSDVIMSTIASLITSLAVVYSTVYSDADQRKHHSSASLAFVWGIHRDRWIPRTKGQLRGKCFHLMTSSCTERRFCGACCTQLLVSWYFVRLKAYISFKIKYGEYNWHIIKTVRMVLLLLLLSLLLMMWMMTLDKQILPVSNNLCSTAWSDNFNVTFSTYLILYLVWVYTYMRLIMILFGFMSVSFRPLWLILDRNASQLCKLFVI